MAELVDTVRSELHDVFAERPVVLVGGPAAGARQRVEQLERIGVERCLVIATGLGTGGSPADLGAEVVIHEIAMPADPMDEFRVEERLFADPPADLVAAIDRFDPDGDAIVLAPPFFDVRSFGERVLFGPRRVEWVALEDKTLADDLFDGADVPRPASEIVAARADDIVAAAARLDYGDGTVWAADARDGFNGGGHYVRWVRDDDDRREALEFLMPRCDRVRVAQFVEGIPCSVHGFVTGDGVAAFRPVELVTLRAPTSPRLRYSGASTFFDPAPADTAAMLAAARRVGEALRTRVDFRGTFTLDGILSADGWVATECNPRFGAGVGYVGRAVPDLCFGLLHHAVAAGVVDVPAAALEAAVFRASDTPRWGGAWTVIERRCEETVVVDFDDPAGQLSVGPSAVGGFVRFEVAPTTPVGPSIAPIAVAVFARADNDLQLGIGVRAPVCQVR